MTPCSFAEMLILMLKGRGISVAHVCVREREWEREGGSGRGGEGRRGEGEEEREGEREGGEEKGEERERELSM